MQITNSPGVDPHWIELAQAWTNTYDKVGDHSVTTLISPVRPAILWDRHQNDDDFTLDITDFMDVMDGQVVHALLEMVKHPDELIEERIVFKFCGMDVSMKPDRVVPIGFDQWKLFDYKRGKVWAVILDTKEEWIRQINMYRLGLKIAKDIDVCKADINVWLKDWDYKGPRIGHGSIEAHRYPKYPLQTIPIPLWNIENAESYLEGRIRVFQNAAKLDDDQLPECTSADRWERAGAYKVKKKGRKKSIPRASFNTRDEAESFASKQTEPCTVWHKPGEQVRCQYFCRVRNICRQYARIKAGENGE